MTPPDDMERLLGQRFAARAESVRPMADPGPAILVRASRAARRRRDGRIAGAVLAVVVVALIGVVAFGPRHPASHLRTADGSTTTSLAGCSVADTCAPASVDSITVGSVPDPFVLTDEPPPVPPSGQQVVEVTYTSTVAPTHGLGTSADQLVIRVATASAAETSSIAQQVSGWSAVDVGPRPGRATTVVNGAGTPAQTTTSYLQIQISPTVTLSMRGAALTTDQLIDVALSITLS